MPHTFLCRSQIRNLCSSMSNWATGISVLQLFFETLLKVMRARKVKSQTSIEDNNTCSADQLNRSNKSGTGSSVPCRSTVGGEVRELANDLAHELDNMRSHLRAQARWADLLKIGARDSTSSKASELHRPPVSRATTTKWHLSPSSSSAYLRSLSGRALARAAPFSLAAPGSRCHSPFDVNGKLSSVVERKTSSQNFDLMLRRPHSCLAAWRCTAPSLLFFFCKCVLTFCLEVRLAF